MANSTQRLQTTTSTTKTKTNDGANKSQNLTPSVDNIKTPPDKSAKGVAELDNDNLSTTAAASTSSSPVSTLDSAKKDLDSKFSTADNNNNINATTELEGILSGVINAYYVDGESGIEAGYLRDLLFCYRKEEGHNVRLVKAAINILVDIEGSINNDTSDPLHIQQKSRKRSGNDAAVSNIPIRADSDNVCSQVGELQNQLSRERDSSTQITAQAGASIRLLENYIENDGAIHNNNINTLGDTVARRDERIQEFEGELNNTPNANQYLQITELENQVAEQSNQITELRDGLATQEASHQAIVNDLQVRLGSATSQGDTLSAEVVQLRDTLTTLETDYTNRHAQLGDLIDENIDLELSKTVAEDHRDDLIEQVSELTMESLAKDHAFELSRQGHDEELERLQYIHLAELQHEADRAGLELEQTQAESRGDAARAAERAESVVYRVKAEAREQVRLVKQEIEQVKADATRTASRLKSEATEAGRTADQVKAEAERNAERLQAESDRLRSEAAKANADKDNTKRTVNQVLDMMPLISQKLEGAQAKLQKVQAAAARDKAESESAKLALFTAKAEVEREKAAADQAARDKAESEAELARVRAELQDAVRAAQRAVRAAELTAEQEISQVKAEAVKFCHNAAKEVSDTKKTLSDVKSKAHDLLGETTWMVERIQELETQEKDLREQFEKERRSQLTESSIGRKDDKDEEPSAAESDKEMVDEDDDDEKMDESEDKAEVSSTSGAKDDDAMEDGSSGSEEEMPTEEKSKKDTDKMEIEEPVVEPKSKVEESTTVEPSAESQYVFIFDCEHISKTLQLMPGLLIKFKELANEYRLKSKGLRETFCRTLAREMFEREDMAIICDGIPLEYTDKNRSYLAEVLHETLRRRMKLVPSPQASSTPSKITFADDTDEPLETAVTPPTWENNWLCCSWMEDWEKYFSKPSSDEPEPSLVVKPVLKPSTEWKYNTTSPVIASQDDENPLHRPNLLDDDSDLLSSDAEANEYLETTYRLTPSEAAEEAAIRANADEEEDEEDDIPAASDRGYFHASLERCTMKGRVKFHSSKLTAMGNGYPCTVRFGMVSEAALFADCMLYIRWHRDGDDPTYNFDTINKFIRHHEAEVAERDLDTTLAQSIADVRAEVMDKANVTENSRMTGAVIQARRTAVLNSLVIDENDDDAVSDIDLCWEEEDDEEVNDAESAGEDDDGDSSEDDESDDGVDVCGGNEVFNMIYNNTEVRPEYSISAQSNRVVIGNRRKGLAKDIAKAFNASQGIDGSDASQFQTESCYVSSVHDHEHHDGYSAFEGKQEDIERTKKEIAQRKQVAHQMRGLHLALTHKKIRAYEKKKQEFLNKVNELDDLWKFMEDKRSDKDYHKRLDCTFADFKKRVETDTGLRWEELADWGEPEWKKNKGRIAKVGTLAYRILKRLDPGCGFCLRLISSYPLPSQLYGWHGDHTRDKTADPSEVAAKKTIPELLDEMRKCQQRCWFCHDFGTTRSWDIESSSYICQLDYPVGFESKSARDVFNMPSFQAFLWDAYVRGGWSGRNGFTPFSYDTLEMMVWQHFGFALEDLVTWPASHWKNMCAKNRNQPRIDLVNGVLYSIIKKLSRLVAHIMSFIKTRQLPKDSTAILENWFNSNIRRPFPTPTQKHELKEQTGLSQKQIEQWFTNTRKRSPEWQLIKSSAESKKKTTVPTTQMSTQVRLYDVLPTTHGTNTSFRGIIESLKPTYHMSEAHQTAVVDHILWQQ